MSDNKNQNQNKPPIMFEPIRYNGYEYTKVDKWIMFIGCSFFALSFVISGSCADYTPTKKEQVEMINIELNKQIIKGIRGDQFKK